MAEITIGGVVYKTAPMNFVAWPIAWPQLGNVIADERAMFKFVACGIVMTDADAEQLSDDGMAARVEALAIELRRKFRMPEKPGLEKGVSEILAENGFVLGEGVGAAVDVPTTTASTATSTESSAESSSVSDQQTGA